MQGNSNNNNNNNKNFNKQSQQQQQQQFMNNMNNLQMFMPNLQQMQNQNMGGMENYMGNQEHISQQNQHNDSLYNEHMKKLKEKFIEIKEDIQQLPKDPEVFKNHQLPLARVKKIMKSDEDVRMIAAEAPVLFAKACEIFIIELTHRAWLFTEEGKRRTLQKNDIAACIYNTEIFDFLIDVIPKEEFKQQGGTQQNIKRPIGNEQGFLGNMNMNQQGTNVSNFPMQGFNTMAFNQGFMQMQQRAQMQQQQHQQQQQQQNPQQQQQQQQQENYNNNNNDGYNPYQYFDNQNQQEHGQGN